jgi:branched-chain amino acid transport system substrate-binding protein
MDNEKDISRRQFLTGAGAIGAGALVVGGVAGGFIGRSTAPSQTTSSVSAGGKTPFLIGSPYPTTGPYAADGVEMKNGTQLAIDEINTGGGIAGRKINRVIVDTQVNSPEGVTAAFNNLVSQKVDAIVGGYVQVDAPTYDIVPPYGSPYLHGNTLQEGVAKVIADPKRYSMIFNVDPTEVWYGYGFPKFLDALMAGGKWKPPAKTASVIQGDLVYSQTIAQATAQSVTGAGWTVTGVEKVTTPVSDWGPVLGMLHAQTPAVAYNAHPAPADQAAFMKQFVANPTPSLVYLQYGPSIPQFLQLAGSAANGAIWSTVIGNAGGALGRAFTQKYQAKYGTTPGLANAPQGYDTIYLLAEAWGRVGDPRNFTAVSNQLRTIQHRGVSGTIYMNQPGQYTSAYPDASNDLSLSMPHLFLQIQNGQHRIIYPPPYADADYQTPPWMPA